MIKLLKLDTLNDGTQRFQSQLYVGKDTIDFVMGTDNIMLCWRESNGRFDFYEFNEPYEIVLNESEMKYQELS
jgi:hypothetical protein